MRKQDNKRWKELARDLRAFGSIPFYIIIMIRALVGPYWDFLTQLSIALAALMIITQFVESDNHIARAMILWIFTVLFYQSISFTIFSAVILSLVIAATIYLKFDKNTLAKGLIVGVVCSGTAYIISSLL